jgi:DNA-binding MarR family transcriptional regulator
MADKALRAAKLIAMTQAFDFQHAPGHLIRRAQQVAVSIFMEETSAVGITPVQFALLTAVMGEPGMDQTMLADAAILDAATTGSAVGRMERKGWLKRWPDASDKRRKLLQITAAGEAVLQKMNEPVARAQQRILAPLTSAEQSDFLALLAKVGQSPE